MMWERRVLSGGIGIAILVAAGLLLSSAQGLQAQLRTQERGRVSVEGRAGIAIPVGELDDIADVGPSFGAGVAYFFHPNIGVMADVQVSLLSASAPDPFNVVRTSEVNLTHIGGGLVLDFFPPSAQDAPLTFRLRLLNGITVMSADDNGLDFSETYYTFNGGGRIGYQLSPKLELFAGTDVYVLFTRASETAAFFQGPNPVEPIDLAISLPVTIGIKAKVR